MVRSSKILILPAMVPLFDIDGANGYVLVTFLVFQLIISILKITAEYEN